MYRYKDRLTSNGEVNEGSYKSMRIHEPVWFKIVDDYEFHSSVKKLLERLI